jgi:hypothetical protein
VTSGRKASLEQRLDKFEFPAPRSVHHNYGNADIVGTTSLFSVSAAVESSMKSRAVGLLGWVPGELQSAVAHMSATTPNG